MNGWSGKTKELKEYVIRHLDCDIFGLCETFLVNNTVINIDGYTWFGNNRTAINNRATRGSGGVGILVKNEVCNNFHVYKLDSAYEGILWLKLTNKEQTCEELLVCSCYCPPPSSSKGNLSQEFFDQLLTTVYMYYDGLCPCVIIGDFNARIGNLQDFDNSLDIIKKRECVDITRKNYEPFLNFLNDSRFCVLNGRYDSSEDNFTSISSKGSAVVDYVCVPYDTLQYVSKFNVITINDMISTIEYQSSEISALPDHSILTCILNQSPYHEFIKDCNETTGKSKCDAKLNPVSIAQKRYKIENVNINMFANERTSHALWNIIDKIQTCVESQNELDTVYSSFVDLLHSEMDKVFRTFSSNNRKLRTGFKKPWWNTNLNILFRNARSAEHMYLKAKKIGGNSSYLRHIFVSKRKLFDKEFRKEKRKYLLGYQSRLGELKTNDPKRFWEEIARLGPQNKKSTIPQEVILNDGKTSTDINEILHTWENEYKTLFEDINSNNCNSTEFINRVKDTMNIWDNEFRDLFTSMNVKQSTACNSTNDCLNSDIKKEEVCTALKLAKSGKSVGIDNIPNEILKCTHIEDVLHVLFNKCFHYGMVPSIWSQTLISPIAKPGKDPRIPTNCRGISLVSTISKIFSNILNLRLVDFIESNNILCEEQNGFRKMRSCVEHIYTLSTIIKMKKRSNKSVFACFIDFAKAFDSVNRDLLWFRLLNYGIDGKFLQVVRAMYTNLQMCVKLHNHLTNWFDSNVGVRQGDTLSPTLFNLFVNTLAAEIKELNCGIKIGDTTVSILLYADDIVLIAETETSLQKMLDTVYKWCQKWQLNINCSKTQIVHFRKKSERESNFEFKLGEKCIEKVNKYRYLGVELNYSLNFSETVETLSNASSRSLGSLVHKYYKAHGFQPVIHKKLYEATVCKIMDHGAGIWGGPSYNKCEVVQHRAMRTILGVGRQTPIIVVACAVRAAVVSSAAAGINLVGVPQTKPMQ